MADPNVYKLWQEGNTSGVFQFESQGITNFMKELKARLLRRYSSWSIFVQTRANGSNSKIYKRKTESRA